MLKDDALRLIDEELSRACEKFNKYNSDHEGYAVIKEELDELWEEVKTKRSERDRDKLRNEAMQVATTALRFMVDLC